eukprot:13127481-Alexandrium_andersonii.AAC.1
MAPKRRPSILRWGLPAGPPPGHPLAARRLGSTGPASAAPVGQARHPTDCRRPPIDAPGQARCPPDCRRPPGLDEESAPRGPPLVAERLCPRQPPA